ncbi:acireductone synthase [Blastopirellula marina]|uniref:Enolase-phosphatase E1 n=1 Tax=Blastopirellula marina TaxID=124 RepID=A0A2S8G4E5_9BACT|nr:MULTISPECIES: acireductone synthase [Pirellulaceae]PQO39326.1 acireductone synthase [Blastopirellula marina]RCS55634.1 acireductone synthase [Bremerella cremea]
MPSPWNVILLDIEGTTSSVSYVFDVMFPYVLRELDAYLVSAWNEPALAPVLDQIAKDAGSEDFATWTADCANEAERREKVAAEIRRLMDGDVKATGLKALQGMIWKDGFERGEMTAQVYADVPEALEAWTTAGLRVFIYSSGSIGAQKLFFGHSEAGNLLKYFSGHFDTTTGPKKEAASYNTIAAEVAEPAEKILFISDIVAELDAAKEAGMCTLLSIRPGNKPVEDGHIHEAISSFAQVSLG